MEGWLQVPPERNLMGRAAWKVRYVVFGRDTSSSNRLYNPVSPVRPTSAADRHSFPSGASDNITNDIRSTYFLSIYKQKNDSEPVSKYSIQEIASCYVGDLGIKQKKQVILPTLIIHLKTDAQQVTSPRSFRRRSHDNPYASKSSPVALLFRPVPDAPDALQLWAREIQHYLNLCTNPLGLNVNTTSSTEHHFSDTPHTSTSLFFVNGEPNTALLSPSLRSKCSDLSSIPSDRRSISSSSLSELPSPRVDEHGGNDHHGGRTTLHIATNSEDFDAHELEGRHLHSGGSRESKVAPRRETILDRYFSSIPSPITSSDTPISSSIARFEALMDEIEARKNSGEMKSGREGSLPSLTDHFARNRDCDIPKRIPTPTLRALEFVSTGICHPDDLPESTGSSPRNSLIILNDNRRLSIGAYSNNNSPSRRNSDSSIGAASSATGGGGSSVVGSLSGFSLGQNQLSSASATKRHSISDFSGKGVGITGSGYYSAMTAVGQGAHGVEISRPGSISEFTHDFSDEATLAKLATAQNFHSRNNKPTAALLNDFKF